MGKRKDSEAAAPADAATAPINASVKADAPLQVETPKLDSKAEPIKIEPTQPETLAGMLKIEIPNVETAAEAPPAPAASATPRAPFWHHAPLAASLAAAAILGAGAGAAATGAFSRPQPAATMEEKLKETVASIGGELSALRTQIEAATRTTTTQLGKLTERIDRSDKAQSDSASRLAKISETLDRRGTAPIAPEATGSVTAVDKKDQGKPQHVEGWKLREYFAGRALLESRNGTLYEVRPGSSLPGLGRVESVKRHDNRVEVVTAKGVISETFEAPPRRPPAYIPYRYY